jgi:all-trans-retinol 13,14-reductase
MTDVDMLVIGSGLAGLSVAALAARDGQRVRVLEAHEHAGGYAHTFRKGAYQFCAEVHYVFDAGEGETIDRFLGALGLRDEVRFHRLDPEGFDHVVVGTDRYRVPNGLAKHRDRLVRRFPEEQAALHDYFALLAHVRDELAVLPEPVTAIDWLRAPLRFPHLLRDRTSTVADVFDRLHFSPRLRTVLAGQAGDYLLPPKKASFLVHAKVVTAYDRGAHYPEKHFVHLVSSIVRSIAERPGCDVRLSQTVTGIEVQRGRVAGVRTADGTLHTARRYVSNVDPRQTLSLAGAENFPTDYRGQLDYAYSSGTVTLYLGLEGIDLREHGFGSFNVWHYPEDDIDRIYARQLDDDDLSRPWLFLSTPTLHTGAPGLAPAGGQTLCVATCASAEPYRALRREDRDAYRERKRRIRDGILDVISERYVPGLRDHVSVAACGTPATNERFVGAPFGNAYGADLGPHAHRVPMETPLPNLFLCNASAGWPSVAGTIASGMKLHEKLGGGGVP